MERSEQRRASTERPGGPGAVGGPSHDHDVTHAHSVPEGTVTSAINVPKRAGAGARSHQHDHPHHKRDAVIRRLKRAEGHLAAVRRMVEDGRDCPDILIQIAAVRAALDATSRVVLADHVESCLHDAGQNGDPEAAWTNLRQALESFIR